MLIRVVVLCLAISLISSASIFGGSSNDLVESSIIKVTTGSGFNYGLTGKSIGISVMHNVEFCVGFSESAGSTTIWPNYIEHTEDYTSYAIRIYEMSPEEKVECSGPYYIVGYMPNYQTQTIIDLNDFSLYTERCDAPVLYFGEGFNGKLGMIVYDIALDYGWNLSYSMTGNIPNATYKEGKNGFLISFGIGVSI